MMESADDAIPAVEVYRGVPIEDQQPAARIEGIVKPQIDFVLGMTNPAALVDYAADKSRPPECRMLAAAMAETMWTMAAEARANRPAIDLEFLHAVTAFLGSKSGARLGVTARWPTVAPCCASNRWTAAQLADRIRQPHGTILRRAPA